MGVGVTGVDCCPICDSNRTVSYSVNYDGEPIDKDGNVITISEEDETCPLCGAKTTGLVLSSNVVLTMILVFAIIYIFVTKT